MINLFWLIYIPIDAIANWYIIEKKKEVPNYILITIIRGMVAILFGGLVVDLQPNQFWPYLGFTVTSFWLIFDPLLNILRGKSLFYIGKNAKFAFKYPIVYWSLKVIALLVAVLSLAL